MNEDQKSIVVPSYTVTRVYLLMPIPVGRCRPVGDGIVDRFGPRRMLPMALTFVAFAYAVMPAATGGPTGSFASAFV